MCSIDRGKSMQKRLCVEIHCWPASKKPHKQLWSHSCLLSAYEILSTTPPTPHNLQVRVHKWGLCRGPWRGHFCSNVLVCACSLAGYGWFHVGLLKCSTTFFYGIVTALVIVWWYRIYGWWLEQSKKSGVWFLWVLPQFKKMPRCKRTTFKMFHLSPPKEQTGEPACSMKIIRVKCTNVLQVFLIESVYKVWMIGDKNPSFYPKKTNEVIKDEDRWTLEIWRLELDGEVIT